MTTMTIQLPAARRARLKRLAERRGVSVNRLLEEFSISGLAQGDAELRFRAMAAKGSPVRALKLLDKVDAAFARRR